MVTKKRGKEKISLEKINLEKKKTMKTTRVAADGPFGLLLRTGSEHL